MLNKNTYKIDSLLIRYFLFFALLIGYSPFTGCGCIGVRKDFIPKRNKTFSSLDINTKKLYLDLANMADPDEREVLEKKINIINDPCKLMDFIKNSIQNHKAYNQVVKLFPELERNACKQKFIEAIDKDDVTNFIKEYQNKFKILYDTSLETQRYYTDLLGVLPVEKAVALKVKIIKATNPSGIEKLIMSYLPNTLKHLNEESKANLECLSDNQRKDILRKVIENDQKQYTVDSAANRIAGLLGKEANLNIETLIKGKIQEEVKKSNSDIPDDEWGAKLPVRDQEREQFLLYTVDLQYEDKKKLKELFDKTHADSLENIAKVFFTAFTTDQERKDLLEAIIYLYKTFPKETVFLCNDPESLSNYTKFKIFCKTNKTQFAMLQKLDSAISELCSNEN